MIHESLIHTARHSQDDRTISNFTKPWLDIIAGHSMDYLIATWLLVGLDYLMHHSRLPRDSKTPSLEIAPGHMSARARRFFAAASAGDPVGLGQSRRSSHGPRPHGLDPWGRKVWTVKRSEPLHSSCIAQQRIDGAISHLAIRRDFSLRKPKRAKPGVTFA